MPLSINSAQFIAALPRHMSFRLAACARNKRRCCAQVSLRWKVQEPFRIEPPTAQLPPGQVLQVQALFMPQDACAFTGTAACELDTGGSSIVRVREAVGGPFCRWGRSSCCGWQRNHAKHHCSYQGKVRPKSGGWDPRTVLHDTQYFTRWVGVTLQPCPK
jgi:hypothetical protein